MQVGVARRCRPRPLSPESGAPTCENVSLRRLNGRVSLVDRVRAIGATSCGPLRVRGGLLGLRRAVALKLVVHVFDYAGSQPARDALPGGVRANDAAPPDESRVAARVRVPTAPRDVDEAARLSSTE